MSSSAIYFGRVRHVRRSPRHHRFSYRLFMVYLDLETAEADLGSRSLWSTNRPALAWFRRRDHFGPPDRSLAECARDLVQERTGRRPQGPVHLLTHLRYFGFVMNPVSFYYCHDDSGTVAAIIAEVTNTPWKERHCYVLDITNAESHEEGWRWVFPKAFHVSPFMPMDQRYDWRFSPPGPELSVRMKNLDADGQDGFDACIHMDRRPINRSQCHRALFLYPLMTAKVVAAIYWNALKLWLQRVPVHDHPRKQTETNPN